MTALAGMWLRGAPRSVTQSCSTMLSAMKIFGEGAPSIWGGGNVALGRRLFATLPEDRFDHQPLVTGDSKLVLVADVRLDNREDLQALLRLNTDRAATLCDAEILLLAWERWNLSIFDHLVGDYAFALWDNSLQRLYLARDPLGHRPLHYFHRAGLFAFASMPKGLHALPEAPREPDEGQLIDFLALMPERGTRTFFADILRVEPGTVVTVSHDSIRCSRHWSPTYKPLRLRSLDDYSSALREQLDRAVRAQLRRVSSPIGGHLSGGLDSSAVVATAAKILSESGGRIAAFTSVPRLAGAPSESKWKFEDEGPLAAATAAMYPNIDHTLVPTSGASFLKNAAQDFYYYDRPLMNLCNMAWEHQIAEIANQRGISTFLVGNEGNSSLTYDGVNCLPELLARGPGGQWLKSARAVVDASTLRWTGAIFHSLGPWIPGVIWDRLLAARGSYVGDLVDYTGLNPDAIKAAGLRARSRADGYDLHFRPVRDTFASRVSGMRDVDNGNYFKGMLGGWGIDMRDPMSDRRLVEFCLNIPPEVLVADGRSRSLARRTLADRLPAEVLAETRRGRQAADWREGLTAARSELTELLDRLSNLPIADRTLDLSRLRRLVEDWPEGDWDSDETLMHYRYALLRASSVGSFMLKATGSNA